MSTLNGQTLSERQKGLAACACLMAQGDLERLEPAVRQALDNGVTINELKEAFSQLYAYTGFPRSLNALGVLSKVLENRQQNWLEGKPWTRPAVELRPGVIIEIPEGVKHWHGAAKDSWFQHLTYHKDVQEGASNEWLEPVSDGHYSKL